MSFNNNLAFSTVSSEEEGKANSISGLSIPKCLAKSRFLSTT
jgi:hypothetical protein